MLLNYIDGRVRCKQVVREVVLNAGMSRGEREMSGEICTITLDAETYEAVGEYAKRMKLSHEEAAKRLIIQAIMEWKNE